MSIQQEIKSGQTGETASAAVEDTGAYAPRKLTLTESVILTIKVLAGFGLLGAALWGINLWIIPE